MNVSGINNARVTLRMPIALLLVSSLVTGVALTANDASTARVDTPAIGAWLATDGVGVISHVGPGGIDAAVEIQRPVGRLQVTVVDGQVVLSDEGGHVTRLDEAALAIGQEAQLASSARLAGGGDRLYVIDAAVSTVQELDSADLTPVGDEVELDRDNTGTALGDGVVDDDGTLWVTDRTSGTVIEILGEAVVERHSIAPAGTVLDLAVTDAGAVVVDPTAATIQTVGSGRPFDLPFNRAANRAADRAADNELIASDHVDGTPILPVRSGNRVALANPVTGAMTVVDLGVSNHDLGAPVVAGTRVLIPDFTDATLHVIDLTTNTLSDGIVLPEPTADFETISDGEVAYVNDRTSSDVWIVSPDGTVSRDDKFDPDAGPDGATPPADPDATDDELAIPPPPATPPRETPPSATAAPRPPTNAPVSTSPAATPPSNQPPNAAPPVTDTPPPETAPPATDPPATDPPTDAGDGSDNPAGDGAVQIDSLVAGIGRASVGWTAPSDWRTVDAYLVRVIDQSGQIVQEERLGAGVRTFEANGLTNGSEYRFQITASSGAIDGAAVISSAVRPDVTGDGAVTNLSARAANGTATATWGQPTGWYDVAEYVVTVTGPAGEVDVEQVDADVFDFTSAAVTNGTTYVITVQAIGVGNQPGRALTSDPVTPTALSPGGDGTVTVDVATVGSTANVSWSAPLDWYAVDGYDVVALRNGAGVALAATTVDPVNRTAQINGLLDGQTYRVQVTARSAQGPGQPSLSIPFVTYGGPAVINLIVVAGDGRVDANWTATSAWQSATNQQGYQVNISPGGFTEQVSGSARSYSRAGLTNGQTYTMRITRLVDSSPVGTSTTSPAFTPTADTPSAPTITSLLATADSILLDWTAPTSGNFNAYQITARPTDGSPAGLTQVAGTRTSHEIRNLTSGQTYDVSIAAVHPNGSVGPADVAQNVTLSGRPDAPNISGAPTSSADGRQVTLAWTAGAANGSQITEFRLNGTRADGTNVLNNVSVGAGITSFTVTGLQPSTRYDFTVAAVNGNGASPAARFASITTTTPQVTPAPNPPQNLQGVAGLDYVDLTWQAPAGNGATLVNYELSVAGGPPIVLPLGATSHRANGLANGTGHTFSLRAVGSDGQRSTATTIFTSTTMPTPAQPVGVNATALGQTSIRISWTQPNPASTASWVVDYSGSQANASGTSIDISGLQPGTTYQIRVQAVGPTGLRSGFSVATSVTTQSPPPVPRAVTGLTAYAEYQFVNATWNPAADADGYQVSINGGSPIDVGGSTSYFWNNVTADSGTVTVRAYNSSGVGPATTVNWNDICPGPVAC